MVHHFDHRFGDYRDHPEDSENLILPDVPENRLKDPAYSVLGRYWVSERIAYKRIGDLWKSKWLLGWRDITKPQKERTAIASIFPWVAVGHTTPLMFTDLDSSLVACLYASLCSFPLDYAARQKVGGTHLTYSYLKQLPVLAPSAYAVAADWHQGIVLLNWILPRVLELTYTAWDLEPFARDVGFDGPPFRWDAERRFLLRCELDAAFFHLYGLNREDTAYVMDTFPIVRKHDEKAHGEYRTKRVILEIYDEMMRASGEPMVPVGHVDAGPLASQVDPKGPPGTVPLAPRRSPLAAYPTRLNPPPAEPSCCHPDTRVGAPLPSSR